MNWAATRSATTGSTPSSVNRSRLNRDPMTAAALNVRFASGGSRSMRAAMVACNVAGTLTSATSAVDMYAPRSPRSTPRSASSRTISSAKNGLPAARSAIVWPSPPTEGSGPSSSETSAAVSESLNGARAMVCAPCHLRQCAAIFRAVREQHQRGRLRDHREELGQHRLADLIDPMGVLNDIDRRGFTRQRRGIHQCGQPPPTRIRIDPRQVQHPDRRSPAGHRRAANPRGRRREPGRALGRGRPARQDRRHQMPRAAAARRHGRGPGWCATRRRR